ncbi:alpha/beta hydrolase [Streptomyces sp. PT12]|uniref:alpha/beta hydrolase n=1 Tax=Streptomyces sp. PT12 TaxID=1510197 RepID=UPI000DE1B4B3|nr:alpha/beta hydrolase [Streptomyces sp. PT12]RBM11935.1 esterase [Streptomyces sp. PT12]
MTDPAPLPHPVLESAATALADATAPHPRIYEVPPVQGRDILAGLQGGDGVERPRADEEWVTVDGGAAGRVRVRILRPDGVSGTLPAVLYLHGGGWVFGDELTHDRLVRELVAGAGVAAAFPLYDRAPEARYPTALEQCYAVAHWLAEEGGRHGIDGSRIAVCGDSEGGTLAAGVALLAAERRDVRLRGQVLLYPVLDATFETASYLEFADGYYLTRDAMMWYWDQYAPEREQRAEIHACPLRAPVERLGDLPPTLLITAEADVVRDEGEGYAAKLRAAEVDVTAVRVLGTVHDFLMLDSLRDHNAARVARHLAIDALREALHG